MGSSATVLVFFVCWALAAVLLRACIYRIGFCQLNTRLGRSLIHTGAFFSAPFHALVVMSKSLAGVWREIRKR